MDRSSASDQIDRDEAGTTRLYDRAQDEITLDEVEGILI
jgi:hypothetical protein